MKALGIDGSMKTFSRLEDNKSIIEAIQDSNLSGKKILSVKDKSGNLQAAASFHMRKESGLDTLHVDLLATAPWNAARGNDARTVSGAGARAIAEAAKESIRQGGEGRISLIALSGAKGFYQNIGMTPNPSFDSLFTLSPEKAQELIRKYG